MRSYLRGHCENDEIGPFNHRRQQRRPVRYMTALFPSAEGNVAATSIEAAQN